MSSLTFGQQKLEGVWQQKENKSNILIVYVEDDNIQFYNYQLDKEFHINEIVLNVDNDHVYCIVIERSKMSFYKQRKLHTVAV